jgi:hypothetical protein
VSVAAEERRFTLAEALAAAVLLALGVVTAAVRRPYDAGSWPVAASLAMVSALASVLLLILGLRASRIPSGQSVAAAVWASLPANVFLLSQLAYVGFFFIPLEIVASTLILRIRGNLPRWWVALGLATAVRIATLGLVYAARPAVRALFPWR